MVNELQFRAWDEIRERWLHGYQPGEVGCSICGEVIALGGWLSEVSIEDYNHVVVEQCTGLKDNAGVWIFKGDVLVSDAYPFHSAGLCNYRGLVDWFDDDACWYLELYVVSDRVRGRASGGMLSEYAELCEIIGNIHDNPELREAPRES